MITNFVINIVSKGVGADEVAEKPRIKHLYLAIVEFALVLVQRLT